MTDLTDDEQKTLAFYDNNAASWSDAHLDSEYWKAQLDEFKKLIPEGRILEIGCGGGRDARDLIKRGYGYVGSDISSGLINEARKNVPGHEFIQQNIYELNFSEKFDGFWASAVLLHVPKNRIRMALDSIKGVLKPGAGGYISIKNGEGEELIGGRFFAFWKKEDFVHELEKSGFQVVNYMRDPRSETDDWHCFFVKLQ